MSFQEKILTCVTAANNSIYGRRTGVFSPPRVHNEPKRCPECRRSENPSDMRNANQHNNSPRQMYPAICAQCGKETMVPFKPRGDKPVYCQECYNKMKNPAV